MAENKSQFALNEEAVLKKWKEKDVFQKTVEKAAPKGNFVFFEGPPTANGKPGIHHVLARVFKDVMPRYKTMQGFHVDRKAGWDTHGLPVELQVEKELKISGKPQIEAYGVEAFNKKCKESVWVYKTDFENLTERIGFWLDMEHPYITYNNEYIESIWWILKQMSDKGLLYKGYKVVPQCPRCGTALSSHEVAQGYKNVEENSVYLKFKLKSQENTFILSWTTTPWTLPGNVGLAVGEKIDYVKVKVGEEYFILAKELLSEVLEETGKWEIESEMKGSELLGLEYEPLFPGSIPSDTPNYDHAFKVYAADFVSTTDGTGVVHTAVMYGVDDFNLGEKVGLPKVHTVDEAGKFLPSVGKLAGKFVKNKEVEAEIIADLESRGLLLRVKLYAHDYPFCWRCDSPLLYYAKDSWFIAMESLREQLKKNNDQINWVPEHIKQGRFGEWIDNVKDWAISRQRYWGTPIPIWECDKCKNMEVLGSFEELKNRAGKLPTDKDGNTDVHRPFVDDLTYACNCGGTMKRVPDVFDCWFDSGAMPLAQHHYPFENKELVDNGTQFPAEYICEAIDQTRGWFYTLLAISTCLDKGTPYRNVICLGHIRDKFGKKMSKSKGNVVDTWSIADKFGIDALRMHFFSMNQPGEYKNFDENDVKSVLQKTVMLVGNVLAFYSMYCGESKVQSLKSKVESEVVKSEDESVLDRWILAKLNLLTKEVTDDLDKYHIYEASRRLLEFINELSTWYVRRSRDRFKEEGADKEAALETLNNVLMTLAKLMAPFMPFFVENIYEKLGGEKDSIHLEDWPAYNESLIDKKLLNEMEQARQLVELGLALRDEKGIKVRQPLAAFEYTGKALSNELKQILAEELNVKEVIRVEQVLTGENKAVKETPNIKAALDLAITPALKLEGTLRELVRTINGQRKKQNFTINDRVKLTYQTDGAELQKLFADAALVEELKKATLLSGVEVGAGGEPLKVNDEEVSVLLS